MQNAPLLNAIIIYFDKSSPVLIQFNIYGMPDASKAFYSNKY